MSSGSASDKADWLSCHVVALVLSPLANAHTALSVPFLYCIQIRAFVHIMTGPQWPRSNIRI